MTFSYDLSDKLKEDLAKFSERNKELAGQVNKKIKEIISSDDETIEHYKNLRYGMADFKRVHVGKSFILLFRFFKKEQFVLFDSVKHHDEAYRR